MYVQSEENGENKSNLTSKVKPDINGGKKEKFQHQEQKEVHEHEQYADIMDIAEMDYSQAKRKPPIHN